MPRASWRGFLRLSLVSCPIYLSPATIGRPAADVFNPPIKAPPSRQAMTRQPIADPPGEVESRSKAALRGFATSRCPSG
jgi:hypothetical protein